MKGLVGRSQELTVLVATADRAVYGRGGVLLLAGEAGIGKSLLLETALAGRALRVLAGPSRDSPAPAPYSPILALLRAHLSASPTAFGDVPYRPLLALLLPELGESAPESASTPALLQGALRAALRHLTEGNPTALVLEDLHWTDHATLDLLPGASQNFGVGLGKAA